MSGQKRIVWVDYMRSIGLLLVIGSHVFGTSNPALQLIFGCNVAIMIVVSGFCSVKSSECSIIEYYCKRGLQMIVHPWVFFVIYFGNVGFLSIGSQFPYTKEQVIKTFLFMDGIGYTWIIAVFILTAFVTPLIRCFVEKFPQIKLGGVIVYWIIGLTFFAFQTNVIFVKALLYVSGYVFLSFVGYMICIDKKTLKTYMIGGAIVLICCIGIIIFKRGDVFDISGNKYPPSVYYITYGMTVSLILIKLLSRIEHKLSMSKVSKQITELSKHSFDIYLWHVFGLFFATKVDNVWLKFAAVVIVAIVGSQLYNIIKTAMIKNHSNRSQSIP